MDMIKIEQLEIFAYHGCNEDEKINGQKFYVDANLLMDVINPGISDDLDDTIDYSKVCDYINKFLTENRFNLIEAAATQTSRMVLKQFPKVRQIDLTIYKPSAPIALPFGNVSVSVSCKWHKVYLGIGSNIGDKEAYLNSAIDCIYDDNNCRVLAVSNFIETVPYGPVEQDNFLNGCVEIETLYTPQELLRTVNSIETLANRVRDIHWGPRTLDIDIILYDNEIIAEDGLFVPHVEMHKREFVLEPLTQIAPYAINPVYNKTAKQLLEELKSTEGKAGCSGCPGCSVKDANEK